MLNASSLAIQFAFCLNIFFLGNGAAFFGALVEKNIKKAAWLSTALLFAGFCVSGLALRTGNIWLFYAGMGVLCGLSEGIGYVTPVKNLLLYFGKSKHKALVMAISIVLFGFGSAFCAWMFKYVFPAVGLENTFYLFALIYLMMMSAGAIAIQKPRYARTKKAVGRKLSPGKYLKDPYFLRCWLFMFLNIAMGLVVIGQCAGMLSSIGLSQGAVVFVMMLCGFSNGGGRLLFPAISDYLKTRVDILLLALALEIGSLCLAIAVPAFTPVAFIIVNGCYGCFFACLPAVLFDKYGSSELSFVHGLCLQAWGSAALLAFLVSTFALGKLQLSQPALFGILSGVYALNFINVFSLRRASAA